MTIDRIKLCALAAALATTLTGEAYAQTTGSAGTATGASPGVSSPAPSQSPQSTAPSSRPRSDATSVQGSSPAATQPSAAKGLPAGANSAAGTTINSGAISGGVPAIAGVTPNRAELASSAFTKLDGASRGYLTVEDVRQLEGFESAFRQADQNGDGRLNQSEFNSAWSAYTGNAR